MNANEVVTIESRTKGTVEKSFNYTNRIVQYYERIVIKEDGRRYRQNVEDGFKAPEGCGYSAKWLKVLSETEVQS